MAAKIPLHIPKFRGDNNQSFKDWIAQFEAHCTALDVGAGKKVATLLCCLDSNASSAVTEMIAADGAITYVNIKANLNTRFCGDYYKRSLQNKLQSLKFINPISTGGGGGGWGGFRQDGEFIVITFVWQNI